MNCISQAFVRRKPKSPVKDIKGTNAWSITNIKTWNNGMQMILFQIRSQSCVRRYFKFNRHKDRAEHVERKSWLRTNDRISILYKFVNFWQIKISKLIENLPGRGRKRRGCIRIIFTKLSQDMFLIGKMTADVNRFQWNTPPKQKVCLVRWNNITC